MVRLCRRSRGVRAPPSRSTPMSRSWPGAKCTSGALGNLVNDTYLAAPTVGDRATVAAFARDFARCSGIEKGATKTRRRTAHRGAATVPAHERLRQSDAGAANARRTPAHRPHQAAL